MAVTGEQITFVRDFFPSVTAQFTRKMFGGLGAYPGSTRSEQWAYAVKSPELSRMPYWSAPDPAVDDPDEAAAWARRSLADRA
ncbi:MAG: hypothetical protein ACSHXH_07550 [Marivita sp.]|uniref:hypothetical protein n=1 Tax=Marivita sp. TaxID=2003365 RepID=UPI003EF7B501